VVRPTSVTRSSLLALARAWQGNVGGRLWGVVTTESDSDGDGKGRVGYLEVVVARRPADVGGQQLVADVVVGVHGRRALERKTSRVGGVSTLDVSPSI